jgi:hypothetical protein
MGRLRMFLLAPPPSGLQGFFVLQFLGQTRFAEPLDLFRPSCPNGIDLFKRAIACGRWGLELAEVKLCTLAGVTAVLGKS